LSVLPVSYSFFCFFLTPTFVLAFLPFPGDWQLAGIRVINTFLGAILAVAAMALFFPTLERSRLGKQLMRSVQANRRYLEQLQAHWQGAQNQQDIALARRATGLTHNDTEDSFERLLAEPSFRRGSAKMLEATLAFVTYLRRFATTITSLASFPGQHFWKTSQEIQQRLGEISEQMKQIELEVSGSRTPSTLEQEIEAQPVSEMARHNGERQLVRLEKQVGILRRSLDTMRKGGLLPSVAPTPDLGQQEQTPVEGNHSSHQ
jgi:uncharacterized membrane protein YccC